MQRKKVSKEFFSSAIRIRKDTYFSREGWVTTTWKEEEGWDFDDTSYFLSSFLVYLLPIYQYIYEVNLTTSLKRRTDNLILILELGKETEFEKNSWLFNTIEGTGSWLRNFVVDDSVLLLTLNRNHRSLSLRLTGKVSLCREIRRLDWSVPTCRIILQIVGDYTNLFNRLDLSTYIVTQRLLFTLN